MKRNLPDVLELKPKPALPGPAAEVLRALEPLITEARNARIDEVLSRRSRSLIPVLEGLADPHNGAAILRSADAFGCQEVHIIEGRLPFAVAHSVSRGTQRWLSLERHQRAADCVETLHNQGYKIFAAKMDGALSPEALQDIPKAATVFGNEHKGVSPELEALVDGCYQIPMVGFVESLNVSVAAAITLYHASRGRHGDLSAEERQEAKARILMATIGRSEQIFHEWKEQRCG